MSIATMPSSQELSSSLHDHCVGSPPLPARWERWMVNAIESGRMIGEVQRLGSPLNVIDDGPMQRNIAEIRRVGQTCDVELQVFFARKANKCLTFVESALSCGCGIDTASENEVRQAIDAGADPKQLICTAAIKDQRLLQFCAVHGVTVAIDNFDELYRVKNFGESIPIAIRLSGFQHQGQKLFSRFGFDVDQVDSIVEATKNTSLTVGGIHFHLDGYDAGQRVSAIRQCVAAIDQLRQAGHDVRFLDIGGGFPISYLDDPDHWEEFWQQHRLALLRQQPPITYRNHALGRQVHGGEVVGKPNVYPYHQSPVRADWLTSILESSVGDESIASAVRRRGLQLRCEPGRSLMDGCGMTIARVEFRKRDTEGNWLIGLAMNRTQCRTTSDDFLVDPILLPVGDSRQGSNALPTDEAIEGYLVGAYCMESELLTWRRLRFPDGVRIGDLVVFPNTAGYLMHFMESRSHQFPLAKNVRWSELQGAELELDAIDQKESQRNSPERSNDRSSSRVTSRRLAQ